MHKLTERVRPCAAVARAVGARPDALASVMLSSLYSTRILPRLVASGARAVRNPTWTVSSCRPSGRDGLVACRRKGNLPLLPPRNPLRPRTSSVRRRNSRPLRLRTRPLLRARLLRRLRPRNRTKSSILLPSYPHRPTSHHHLATPLTTRSPKPTSLPSILTPLSYPRPSSRSAPTWLKLETTFTFLFAPSSIPTPSLRNSSRRSSNTALASTTFRRRSSRST